jgi:hypothetical protein
MCFQLCFLAKNSSRFFIIIQKLFSKTNPYYLFQMPSHMRFNDLMFGIEPIPLTPHVLCCAVYQGHRLKRTFRLLQSELLKK